MPKRTSSHTTADTAVNQVEALFLAAGCACEKVKQDYGEDLLIQPSQNNNIEPFRIWAQVKGTTGTRSPHKKSDTHSIPIKIAHLLKWLRSPEYTIVILWNTKTNSGLYCVPIMTLNEHQLAKSGREKTKLHFKTAAVLDKNSAKQIVWQARVEYYSNLFIAVETAASVAAKFEDNNDEEDKDSSYRLMQLAGELLLKAEAIEASGVDRHKSVIQFPSNKIIYFTAKFKKYLSDAVKERDDSLSGEGLITTASMHAVLTWFCHLTNTGVPHHVLVHCTTFVAALLTGVAEETSTLQRRPTRTSSRAATSSGITLGKRQRRKP
ncbi:DUF4365 domain-containing protein [Sorangium sp. So ce362]|uniref:DUF4365 domain-containing protein n=1 Tax=Sorangium sp. So ce362 TaxID=3133303 RepID=UPI003F5FEF59